MLLKSLFIFPFSFTYVVFCSKTINLAKLFSELDKKGCYLMLTNSKNKEILKLYNNYDIQIFDTKRIISKIGSKRTGKDILVKNF